MDNLEIIPNQSDRSSATFTPEDYAKFWERFAENVRPKLERLRVARIESMKESWLRIVD